MSSTSQILSFDFNKFTNVIVPALREGEENLLIREVIERAEWNVNFINLKAVIETFNDSLTESRLGKTFGVDANGIYKTDNLHQLPHIGCWTYGNLAQLIERLILKHCVKYCLTIGKAVRLEFVIDSSKIETKEKLTKLCDSSFIWVHCNFDDNGIYGWLNNNETNKLLVNQSSFVKPDNARLEQESEEIIDSIKNIIQISSNRNLGLIYGNSLDFDIVGELKYLQTVELIKNEEYEGGCPRFNFETKSDYS